MPASAITEEPLTIPTAGSTLHGSLHLPADPPRAAVLFCNPLFEERKAANRTLVDLARAFCEQGVGVLRFDYRGCGDSGGEFATFGPAEWTDDIQTVAALLRKRVPIAPLGILGVRSGGALALAACTGALSPSFTILLEPVVSGHEYLEQTFRQMHIKEMMTYGRKRRSRSALITALDAGESIDVDGYELTARCYRELLGLNAGDGSALSGAAFLLHIAHGGDPPKTWAPLRQRLDSVHAVVETLRMPPFWSLVGVVDSSPVVERSRLWMAQFLSSVQSSP